MNSVQIEELYRGIDACDLTDRLVVFFGANKITELGIRHLCAKGISVAGIIDNNRDKSGTSRYGVNIYTPEQLLGTFQEHAAIFVASRYVVEMTAQLEEMGYQKGKHIFETIYHETTLSDEEMTDKILLLQRGADVYQQFAGENMLLICPYKGIGDIYFIGSYFNAYVEKEKWEKVTLLVVGGVCRRVAGMFGIDTVYSLSQEDMDALVRYVCFVGEKSAGARILNHNCSHSNLFTPFEVSGRISWGKLFLQGILGFENTPEAALPHREKYYGDRPILPDRTVILSPYANTVNNVEMDMWNTLSARLKEGGFLVYTNSAGDSEPAVEGTQTIQFSLEEAVDVIETSGTFIGVRSGFCDVISSADADKIILYPDPSSEFFNIKDMGLSSDVTELKLWENSQEQIIEIILGSIIKRRGLYTDIHI